MDWTMDMIVADQAAKGLDKERALREQWKERDRVDAMLAEVKSLRDSYEREEAFAGIGERQLTKDEQVAMSAAKATDAYLTRMLKEKQDKAKWLLENGWDETLYSVANEMADPYRSQTAPQRLISQIPEELHPELMRRVHRIAKVNEFVEQQKGGLSELASRVGRATRYGLGRVGALGDAAASGFTDERMGTNLPQLDPLEERNAALLRGAAESVAPINPYKWYDPRGALLSTLQQGPMMVPAMAGAAVNPALGVAAAAGTVYPGERERMLIEGASDEDAAAGAALSALAQGAVEMASPFGGIATKGGLRKALTEIGKEALEEVPQQYIGDIAVNETTGRQVTTPGQMAQNAVDAAKQALGPAAIIGGGGTTSSRLARGPQMPQEAPPQAPQTAQEQPTVPEAQPEQRTPATVLRDAVSSGDATQYVTEFPDQAQQIAAMSENPSRKEWRQTGLGAEKWPIPDRAAARQRIVDALSKQPAQPPQTGATAETVEGIPPAAPQMEQPNEEGQRQGQGRQGLLVPSQEIPEGAAEGLVSPAAVPSASDIAAERAQRNIERTALRNQPLGSGAGVPGQLPDEQGVPHGWQNVREDEPDLKDANGVPTPWRERYTEEQRDRANAAQKGFVKTSFQRAKEALVDLKNRAMRSVRELPPTKQFAQAREYARYRAANKAVAEDKALRDLTSMMQDITPAEYRLLSDYQMALDRRESMRSGEPGRLGFKNDPEGIRQNEAAIAEMEKYISASTRPDGRNVVREAIDQRNAIRLPTLKKLVAIGKLPESVLKNPESYFHYQVLAYAKDGRKFGAKRPGSKAGFQKARKTVEQVGGPEMRPELDPTTDLIPAELEWMTDAQLIIREHENFESRIRKPYDILPQIQEEAKAAGDRWQNHVPEGHRAVDLHKAPWKSGGVIEDAVREIDPKAMEAIDEDTKSSKIVVPNEVADMLERMWSERKSRGISERITRGWKYWALNSPLAAIKRISRDKIGNTEKAFAVDPDTFKKLPGALAETFDHARGDLRRSNKLNDAIDRNIATGTMNATELGKLGTHPIIGRLLRGGNPKSIIASIGEIAFLPMETAAMLNEWLDNAFAYAHYLSTLEKLEAGKPVHSGASRHSDIQALIEAGVDKRDIAAKIARELYGDYLSATELAASLSKVVIPFARFMQTNMVAWPRILINSYIYSRLEGMTTAQRLKTLGRSAGAAGARAAFTTAKTAAYSYAGYIALQAGAWMWNNLMWGDAEDSLSEAERSQPHLIYWQDKSGKVYYLRNFGALNDALANIGLPAIISNIDDLLDNKISGERFAKEWWNAMVNRATQAVGPLIKGPVEVISGQRYYPDAMAPRPAPRDQILADNLGVRDLYLGLRGWVMDDGSTSNPDKIARMFANVSDPRQNAWYEAHKLRERWLEKTGEKIDDKGQYGAGKAGMLRRIAWADASAAFPGARRKFLADSNYEKEPEKAYRSFLDTLDRLDPIGRNRLTPEKERAFLKSLEDDERRRMTIARDAAADAYYKLFAWMDKESQSDPHWIKARDKWLGGKVKAAVSGPVDPSEYKNKVGGAQRYADAEQERQDRAERALRDINVLGLDNATLKQAAASTFEPPTNTGQVRQYERKRKQVSESLKAIRP